MDDHTRDRIVAGLSGGKTVDYLSNRYGVPVPHVVGVGFDAGLRFEPKTRTMTARPVALDVADGADPDPLTRAEYPKATTVPSRLLPPKPPTLIAPTNGTYVEVPASAAAPSDHRPAANRSRLGDYNARIVRLGGSSQRIRAWAAQAGLDLPDRGTLPTRILDAYEAAHPAAPAAPERANREGDTQPLPVRNDTAPDVQSQVIADIERRRELGIKRYGTALKPNNGRNALLDAYEETLDLAMYLKQRLIEDGVA